ncbi:hypothetical protein F4782DRAFT_96910 [Xylaria castorea]|nr:hypothetical protein F4782DRAFT_96910 [Xylaria castorea]
MNEHSRSHSRSLSQHKQSLDAPQGYGRSGDHSAGLSMAKPDLSARNGSVRSESTDRGRTMQRRYEFIDSDDKAHTVLSPVQETGKKANGNGDGDGEGIVSVGRESNMTTMTDLMHRCVETSPPKLPTRQNHRQQQANGDLGTSAAQLSLPQPKTKRRPPPLNLKDPVYLGKVRHTDRYEIEHIAIKSSKAELFDCCDSETSSHIYDDRVKNPPRIPPLDIPSLDELRGVDALQLYDEWRKNLKPVRTASQSSIHITAPNWEEDTLNGKRIDQDRLPVVDYPIAQDTPIINHVRSRSALGIRENRDRKQRHRQFSNDSVYTASEYSATPLGQGPGMTRSATMHEVPHSDRQFSNGSGSKASQYGVTLNNVAAAVEMEMLSPPFTPLTPFIMRATGAPTGVERGSKTLFGEHGWLEDTAASGMTKPKMEKVGGFMESLKRKAREIVRHASFSNVSYCR